MNRTLLIGVLLVAGVAVGIFFTWPQFQTFQQVQKTLGEQEQELASREAYFTDLARVKTDLKPFEKQLAKVEAALPSDSQLPGLYDFFIDTIAFSGTSLKSISVSPGNETQTVQMQTIPVGLELTGSWGALKELISRLETVSRMTQLQSLNVGTSPDSGRFSISLQLHTYSY